MAMKYRLIGRALMHGVCWIAIAVVVYSEPLGAWLDEHHPIGGKP